MDLDSGTTQTEFGELIGISQQAVAGLLQRGVIFEGGTAREWLLAYCENLREVAAGRGGDEGIRLNLENTRETIRGKQVDRARKELLLAEKRKQLMPTVLLEEILARAGARTARLLDTITPALRRRFPDLSSADLSDVDKIIAKARNIAATVSLADLDLKLDVQDASAEPVNDAASDDEAAAA